ncbi:MULTISPECIES: helix-turn-helix domain-containing protein [Weissella]|uniref:helix-turn-helix domain-containing protein n=1 Tax=Weissella TaxID=46255 RepID=UPI0002191995|nr:MULTISPECIES: helix-turn-helix transcriptional regulator [Weissella]APS27865.1 hypothetical protein AUC63_01869 [Weissella cibaria]APU63264.1 hypothetical protein AUC65_01476 [Weissella cibaria]APU65414.1 hypothetical protein AUC62_01468 [Weissella cibaria]ASS51209.1 hypothetical protein CHR48_00215 [Weissella cibaria]MBA5963104.1 helix-turn-helix domain-containing protein [Weissella cibaria]
MSLGNFINMVLKNKGLTNYWLSGVTGIDKTTLYSLKVGKLRTLTLRNMIKVAIALDIDLNELKKIDWED